jgi:hypothetical protein
MSLQDVILEYTTAYRGTDMTELWYAISQDPRLTIETIYSNDGYAPYWNYRGVSRNPNLTIVHVVHNPNQAWDWDFLSMIPQFGVATMVLYKHLPWNWGAISEYRATWKHLLDYNYIPWDYTRFIYNTNMNTRILMKYILTYPWNCDVLSSTSFITIDLLLIPGVWRLGWNWPKLTRNTCFSITTILKHNKFPWDWEYVIVYRKLTLSLVFENPNLPYRWSWLCRNNSIDNSFRALGYTEKIFMSILECYRTIPNYNHNRHSEFNLA